MVLQPLEGERIDELGVVLFCRGRPETGFEALGVVVFVAETREKGFDALGEVVYCCGRNARDRI